MVNNAPVGVFDSGMGGLSVLKAICQELPNERFIYFADSRYIPYGEKSAEFITERCIKVIEYFLQQQVKAVVFACNTATAAAINTLRERYSNLPIIGMEPAVKPATLATRNGKVGVLATSGTLKSAKFVGLLDRFADHVEVFAQPCPGLVECIERGDLEGEETRSLLKKYLAPLIEANCDTIILGCTHYPFLYPLFAELLPPSVQLIDTGLAVANHLQTILSDSQLQAELDSPSAITFCTTGDLEAFKQVLAKLWTDKVTSAQQVNL